MGWPMKRAIRIAIDAFYAFNDDDGWAISSHIALSGLMALFPFLIFVTALAAAGVAQRTRKFPPYFVLPSVHIAHTQIVAILFSTDLLTSSRDWLASITRILSGNFFARSR